MTVPEDIPGSGNTKCRDVLIQGTSLFLLIIKVINIVC